VTLHVTSRRNDTAGFPSGVERFFEDEPEQDLTEMHNRAIIQGIQRSELESIRVAR
jgi:hypothetical protein